MNENAEMTDKKLVQTLKEKVDPLLAEHLGGSELVDFENTTNGNVIFVLFSIEPRNKTSASHAHEYVC